MSILRNRVFRRLLRALLVSFGVMTITFSLIRLIPGDPVEYFVGQLGIPISEETLDSYRERLGLDGTFIEQYIAYLAGVVQGDLGNSLITGRSVASTVARTLPITVWLIVVTVVLALIFSIPIGVLAAIYRRAFFGQAVRVISSLLLATPGFYLGLVLILVFAINLNLAPVAGYEAGFPGNLYYLWLPALTMCGVLVPILARVLQSSISDTLEEEFVETAIVRGLPRGIFVWRYLLRPSLAPSISLVGYMIGQMLSAIVVIEIVFNIPGIGTALVAEGLMARDYTLVQGIVLVFGLIVVAVNFVAETISGEIDPRTKI